MSVCKKRTTGEHGRDAHPASVERAPDRAPPRGRDTEAGDLRRQLGGQSGALVGEIPEPVLERGHADVVGGLAEALLAVTAGLLRKRGALDGKSTKDRSVKDT